MEDHSSVQRNIDYNVQNNNGRTALMLACFFEKTDVVKSSLESSEMKHIDLNVRDHHGNTSTV